MPIFDQGYQHWHGPLTGHPWRWLTIARQGIRVQAKGRYLRLLTICAWGPAVALVIAMALWGLLEKKSAGVVSFVQAILPPDIVADPAAYRATVWTLAYSFFFRTQMFFIMLLVAVAGPGLISHDLRLNALPLYFSRPLNRLDYFLGKLGVIGALVASVAVMPAVLAYLVGVCFSLNLGVVKDTWPVLAASVAYGLVVTLSAGTLILALSSLSRRSLYVGIAWAGLWIVSGSVAGSLIEARGEAERREIYEAEMARWVAEHPPPKGVAAPRFFPGPQAPGRRRNAPVVVGKGDDGERWGKAWAEAAERARAKAWTARSDLLRTDWRPLFSYVRNLERIGDQLLDTDTAWVAVGKAVARSRQLPGMVVGAPVEEDFDLPTDDRFLADQWVPQYPWQWSAGVLCGLLGLSTWTLTRRVKSLDRLK